MNWNRYRVCLALAAASWITSLLSAQTTQFADLVFRGGKVITMDGQDHIAEAVAVTGNRITAAGSNAEIARFTGPQTQVIELNGRTLLPGFIDAHNHVQGLAESEYAMVPIQAPPLKGPAEIIAKLKERAAQVPPGTWIVGQGTYLQVMPTREELDRNFPDHPLVLRWSMHDLLLNHKADEVAHLDKNTPDPKGLGTIERTPAGEPIILRDAAIELPLPRPTYQQMRQWIPAALRDFYLKRGVTTVYDMSDPGIAYRIYQEMKQQGELPVRVVLDYIIGPGDLSSGDGLEGALLKTGISTGVGDDWIRVGAMKIILDGTWGATAAVYKQVWKGSGTTWISDNYGGVSRTQELLNKQILEAHKAGWQVWVHGNGDRAQDMVLTALEAAQKAFPRADARHRIEHFGNFMPQDQRTEERLARMQRDGVIPSPQVAFLWRLTNENLKEPDVKFFPMATLIKAGFHPAGGSDTLGTQNFATNPLFSISVAVNRKTKYGGLASPEEAISRMDALRMFTTWAAYAGFAEKTRGSIEAGKLADLVVLSGDPLSIPPEHILDLNVDYTIVDGKIAYQRWAASSSRPTPGRYPKCWRSPAHRKIPTSHILWKGHKMTPTKIIIIRHGEKPLDPPKKPWGVQLDGQESEKSLTVPGWQRAGALNAFFAPYKATPANPAIATPDYIYAASPISETQRPFETVTPLAAWLKYEQNTPQFNTAFKVGGGEQDMVASVLILSGVVLICWEHKNIMPNIMSAINSSVEISNYSKIPPSWPNVFYLVWVLDLTGNTYTWSSTNQNLMAGDVTS